MFEYTAKMVRVVDGDTLEVQCDLGFGVYKNVMVRLRDLNAPELNEDGGEAAALYLEHALKGAVFTLRTYKTKPGKYKRSFIRYIGDIILDDGEVFTGE